MKHSHRLLFPLFMIASLLTATPSQAGDIDVCNHTQREFRVAVAILWGDIPRSWGWIYISPGVCSEVGGRFNGGYLSIYVEYVGGEPLELFNSVGSSRYCVNSRRKEFDLFGNGQPPFSAKAEPPCHGGMDAKTFRMYHFDGSGARLTISRP